MNWHLIVSCAFEESSPKDNPVYLKSWLREIRIRLFKSAYRTQRLRCRRKFTRPSSVAAEIQALEGRALLSAVAWTGDGGDFNWSNAANWDAQATPGGADDVTIGDLHGAAITVSGSAVAIHSLSTSSEVDVIGTSLSLSGDSELNATLQINNGSSLNVTGSTITGSGQLVIKAGATLTTAAGHLNSVDNEGLWNVEGGVGVHGSLTTGTSSTIRVLSNNSTGSGLLVSDNGFTNHGLIELSDLSPGNRAVLAVSQGTLVNAVDGTLSTTGGLGALLQAPLDNQGSLDLQQGLFWQNTSGQSRNSGSIVSDGDLTLLQTGTDPSFTNTGLIQVAGDTTFSISSGSFVQGGQLQVPGHLYLSGVNATLDADTTGGQVSSYLEFSTVDGSGKLINPAGATLTTAAGHLNSVDNEGLWNVEGGVGVHGSLTTGTSSTIRVLSNNSTGSGLLVSDNGFTNYGLIELSNLSLGNRAVLAVSQGTLVNAVGGTLSTTGGLGALLQAPLDNQGSLDLQQGLFWQNTSGQSRNSGSIVSDGDLTLLQTGTDPSFTNTGLIQVAGDTTFSISSGSFVQGGQLQVPGHLYLSGVNATLDADTTGGQVSSYLEFSTVDGSGKLINPAGATLTTAAGHLNSVDNEGLWNVEGGVGVHGSLTTGTSSTIRVLSNNSTGSGLLVSDNGFTNHGLIELSDLSPGNRAVLAVSQGTLVNAVDGTLSTTGGLGALLQAPLDNQGSLDLQQGLFWQNTSGQSRNSGSIVSDGDLTLLQTGTDPSFTNTGLIQVAGDTTFSISSGSFVQGGQLQVPGHLYLSGVNATLDADTTGGQVSSYLEFSTVDGSGKLINPAGATLTTAAGHLNSVDNEGLWNVEGGVGVHGSLTTGTSSTIRVLSNNSTGSGLLVSDNGFTNHGLIELSNLSLGNRAVLAVSQGTLVNAVDGTLSTSGGLGALLQAPLDNQGSLDLQQGLFWQNTSGQSRNSGSIVSDGDLTLLQTGTDPSFTNTGLIQVAGDTTFSISSGSFVQGGQLQVPGHLYLSGVNATLDADTTGGQVSSYLEFSTVDGSGKLINPAGATLTTAAGHLNSVDNEGLWNVEGGVGVHGSLTTGTSSTIRVLSNNSTGSGLLVSDNGFTNHGLIELSDLSPGNRAVLAVSQGTLVNAVDGTLSTTGGLGALLQAPLDNQGSLDLQQGLFWQNTSGQSRNSGSIVSDGDLTLLQDGTEPSFTNSGSIQVGSGTTFSVQSSTFDVNRFTQTAGAINLNQSTIASNTPLTILGGALRGTGTVDAFVSNGGAVIPGLSTGLLTINGVYAQQLLGQLTIELGGTSAGIQYDQIDVQTNVTLAGSLNVTFTNSFVSTAGQTFTIIKNDGLNPVTGTFDGKAEGAVFTSGGRLFQISYTGGDGNDVTLTDIGLSDISTAVTVNAIEGQSTGNVVLATFLDGAPAAQASDFTVSVNWGGTVIGSQSATVQFVSQAAGVSTWQVIGSATYAEAGLNPVTVSVNSIQGGSLTTSTTNVSVADAPLTDTTVATTLNATAGVSTGSVVLATFTDGNPFSAASDFTAAINFGGPVAGTPTASVQLVSTSSAGSTWKVVGNVIYTAAGNYTVAVTVNDNDGSSMATNKTHVAVASSSIISILLLDASGAGALTDSGNGKIIVGGKGEIVVASTNAAAILVSGNGSVTASEIDVESTTGTRVTGNGKIIGIVDSGISAAEAIDPLSALAAPAVPSTQFAATTISGESVVTLQPGNYIGGINISGNAKVTLAPGIYYLSGGGFTVTGNAVVKGSGVLIYNAAVTTSDSISVSGNASVNLSAQTTGVYHGIVFFQAHTATAQVYVSGNASMVLKGTFYAARSKINVSGNGLLQLLDSDSELIASDLNVSGNGIVKVNV